MVQYLTKEEFKEKFASTKIATGGIDSTELQKKLIEFGCGWELGDRYTPRHTDHPYLFIDGNLILQCSENPEVYRITIAKEVAMNDILQCEVIPYRFKHCQTVLVWDFGDGKWSMGYFYNYEKMHNGVMNNVTVNGHYGIYKYCIPYNSSTVHLNGTSEPFNIKDFDPYKMTKEDFKELYAFTKVEVTEENSAKVQNKLMEFGCKWACSSDNKPKFTNAPYLFIDKYLHFSYSTDEYTFDTSPKFNRKAEDILKLKLIEIKDNSQSKNKNDMAQYLTKEEFKEKYANTKIFVKDKSVEIQKVMLAFGAEWNNTPINKSGIQHKDAPFLFLSYKNYLGNALTITYSISTNTFYNSKYREVDVKEFLNLKVAEPEYKFTPFEQVLVRDNDSCTWEIEFFGRYNLNPNALYKYICLRDSHAQCIPYNEQTKHLNGSTEPFTLNDLK